VTNGKGEAQTSAGQFGGASITNAKLVGPLDADGDGTADAVISFTCFGSTFDMCCAERTSMMKFLRVFNFSNPSSPEPIGETIMPGASPVRGESYGEIRYFDQVRIDGSAVVTDEKLVYADTSGATADLGFPPDSTIEVTHHFTDGEWVSSERVIR
jgi:Ca-activated chloride channel family protein